MKRLLAHGGVTVVVAGADLSPTPSTATMAIVFVPLTP